ncbi:hypothetical protein R6Q59_004270 [Mikania micrantha]
MAVWGRATKIGSICMFVVCRSWFMAIWGRCCGTKLDRRRADLVWVVNCFDRGCKWAGFWGCYVVMLCWTMRGRVGLLIVGLLFMLDCFVCRWPDVAQDWLPVADGWPTATCDCLAPVWHGLLWSCYGLQWPNKACCRLYLACCGPCLDPWRLLLVVAGSWYARCGLGWMGSAPCLTLGSPLLAGCGPWSFGFVADLLGWKDIALGPLSGLDMGFHLVNCSLFPLGFLLYMGLWLVGWAYVPLPRFWVVVCYLDLWAFFTVMGLSGCRTKVFLYMMYCSWPNGLGVILLAFPGLSDKCYSGGGGVCPLVSM